MVSMVIRICHASDIFNLILLLFSIVGDVEVLEANISRGAIDVSVQSTIEPLFQCIEKVLSGEFSINFQHFLSAFS